MKVAKTGLIIALVLSLLVNILLGGLLLIYFLTPNLDAAVIQISAPRFCQVLKKYQSENIGTKLFCEVLGEGISTRVDKERLKSILEN